MSRACSPCSPTAPIVHSPLYGTLPATEFYPALFADTGAATLTLLGTMRGTSVEGRALLSFLFHFDWRAAERHGRARSMSSTSPNSTTTG